MKEECQSARILQASQWERRYGPQCRMHKITGSELAKLEWIICVTAAPLSVACVSKVHALERRA